MSQCDYCRLRPPWSAYRDQFRGQLFVKLTAELTAKFMLPHGWEDSPFSTPPLNILSYRIKILKENSLNSKISVL